MPTKKISLSDAQRAMVRRLLEGPPPYHGLRGRSQFGGAAQTLTSLVKKRIVVWSKEANRWEVASWVTSSTVYI